VAIRFPPLGLPILQPDDIPLAFSLFYACIIVAFDESEFRPIS
jgi:hypothetical protein